MACHTRSKMMQYCITKETYDGKRFFLFVYQLIEKLKSDPDLKYRYYNNKMVLVVDNATNYGNRALQLMITESRLKILYLPVYSPMFNPCELVWNTVKKSLSFLNFEVK